MENSKDLHLNIETVTPDTEKDGQPNDRKAEVMPNQQGSTNEKAVESEEIHGQPESDKQEDEPAEQDKPDEGSEIETVSP
ncbi:hypothetical protein ACXZ1K_17615 [Pedobacter sp. PWIIR3]